jgi:hypothetical protein
MPASDRALGSLRAPSGSVHKATSRATVWWVPEPHDLEADQDSYQRGLQEGRAARARSRELGVEPDPESDAEASAASRGQRQVYRRGYRAGLSE